MKAYLSTLAALLVACGADDQSQAPAQAQAAPTEAAPEGPTLFVDAAEDLPPCRAESRGRIVYATAEELFYACEPTGAWQPLDLKGRDGASGAQGPKGDKGDPGTDGADGANGANGTPGAQGPKGDPGADGESATDSMWFDPVDSRWWTFTTFSTTFAVAEATCVGDWRLPTATEYVLANARGLRLVANYGLEAWLQDGTHVRYDGQTSTVASAPYCVEAAP